MAHHPIATTRKNEPLYGFAGEAGFMASNLSSKLFPGWRFCKRIKQIGIAQTQPPNSQTNPIMNETHPPGNDHHIPPKREKDKSSSKLALVRDMLVPKEGRLSSFNLKYTTCAATKICEQDSWLCFLKSSIQGILTWMTRCQEPKCLLEVMGLVKESPSPVGGNTT